MTGGLDTSPAGTSDALAGKAALRDALRAVVGDSGIITDGADIASYCEDWRRLYQGTALAVVRPATVQECADVVRLCALRAVAVVPQGGNTSLVGGATPDESGAQVVVSLSRMTRIRAIDPIDMTMIVEAGLPWRAARDAASAAGCLLPLSLSSDGSAQVGGILSTNAGGNNTVRYGNARDLVLGLEVVMPDGQIWNGLRRLHKDNTGYALRHLLVGAEGTLGIITAAVLKLVPSPRELEVTLCSVVSLDAVLSLFNRFLRHDPAVLHSFEYMSGAGMDVVAAHIPGAFAPLALRADHYVLVELASPRHKAGLRRELEAVLEAALEAGEILDAAIGECEAQRAAIWRLREEHAEAQKRAGASVKNDVSVPISAVPELIRRASQACAALLPGIRPVPFGHFGDGNIHMNLLQPAGADPTVFLARAHDIAEAVNEVVRDLGGSFSAEHGVGCLKRCMMSDWRGGAELEAMQRIKRALDPLHIMNPGKMLP